MIEFEFKIDVSLLSTVFEFVSNVLTQLSFLSSLKHDDGTQQPTTWNCILSFSSHGKDICWC